MREMTELERQGCHVGLYPLIREKASVIHPEAKAWLPKMHYVPFLSPKILATNCTTLLRQPGVYRRVWARALWENRTSAKFLSRVIALFPKAVEFARRMQQENIVHIHAHYASHPALVAWLIHQLTGVSYSITVHAHDIFVRQEMLATKLRDSAFVIAISEYNREFLARSVGPWISAKTHVIHCGIRTQEYPSDGIVRNSDTRFEIMSTGSLQSYKGFPYLLEACALLRNRGIPVHCRIIGDGEQRTLLEKLILRDNLSAEVQLLGSQPQEEVTRLLTTAHCYVQPSIITSSGKMEGIPVSLMEALACGLPVVASNISGIPELVQPGETGYLVPPADAGALADTLATIYAYPDQALKMARNGRILVQREFDLHINVQHLMRLFEKRLSPSQSL